MVNIIGIRVYDYNLKKYGKIIKSKSNKTNILIYVNFDGKEKTYGLYAGIPPILNVPDDNDKNIIKKFIEEARQKEEKIKEKLIEVNNKSISRFKNEDGKESMSKVLMLNGLYGTNSETIYKECARTFGWDESKSKNFGKPMKSLYAKDVTKEGYSFWAIRYSNISEKNPSEDNEWGDFIESNCISEKWPKKYDNKKKDQVVGEKRLVIAYSDNYKQYIFIGIYECIEIDFEKRYAKYQLFGTEYSMAE